MLLSGRIRLYGMAWNQEHTFEVIGSGSVFGIASLAERTQDEYAQTLEPSRVRLLSLNAFWQLVRENPEVNVRVMKLLGERLRRNRGRTIDIALKEVHARLAGLILDLVEGEGIIVREGYYAIPTLYTHEQLSTIIGAKRVAVTRAFGVLQAAGCVRLSRRQIHVINLAALKRFTIAR